MTKRKKPFYKRIWFIVVAVLVAVIALTALSMTFSYGVANLAIKVACNDKNPSTPNNYEEVVADTVLLAEELSYDSRYENGFMDVIAPKGATEKLPLVVYLHGGYYVGGDKKTKEPYCRVVARAGYIVANVNYALAPKEKYPTQVCQANEALKFLVAHADEYFIDKNKIFIGGDSAGGHLSGLLGAYYSNDELAAKFDFARAITKEQLRGVLLLCGFHNASTANENYFFLLPSAMWMFTGKKDYQSYERITELNNVDNVTEAYPSTYLTCGDKDPFYTQNKEMAAKLKEKGVYTVAYLPQTTDKKLEHEFQCDFSLKECDAAMELLLDFLAQRSA